MATMLGVGTGTLTGLLLAQSQSHVDACPVAWRFAPLPGKARGARQKRPLSATAEGERFCLILP